MTTRTRRLGATALATAALAAAGAGTVLAQTPAGDGINVSIADKGFTESSIVAELYKQALETQGFSVSITTLQSTEIADEAIRDGQIDIYPDYDGTTYLNVLKLKPGKAPASRAAFFAVVRKGQAARGLTALNPAPYNNGNEVACTISAIRKYKIANLSRLGKASPNLTYAANPEHLGRADGLPLLRKSYGVRFKSLVRVDINLRYKPIQDNKADCVYAFGTDPQLSQLRNKIRLIRDNKGLFSGRVPFRTYPIVNTDFLNGLSPAAKTAFVAILGKVDRALTQNAIQRLNAQVDLQKDDASDVARAFLKANKIK